MNLEAMPDSELQHVKAKLERELLQLRATRKNLNNTIRNITDDMNKYYTRDGHDVIINGNEVPRA